MSETTTIRADRARPARPQAVLTVLGRERLSPHTVRITADGPGFDALRMNPEPGDVLTMSGAGGAYRPDPASDWHLLAGP